MLSDHSGIKVEAIKIKQNSSQILKNYAISKHLYQREVMGRTMMGMKSYTEINDKQKFNITKFVTCNERFALESNLYYISKQVSLRVYYNDHALCLPINDKTLEHVNSTYMILTFHLLFLTFMLMIV